jgi:class 3 adenylate cyclase/pimeloyl-ACP methyl ester carboxylesterase
VEPEIRYCTTTDGVSIAYYAMGDGETLLIASNVAWSNVRHALTFTPEYHRAGAGIGRDMRVVRYDARGTGMSDRSALDFTLEARLRDLEAVVAKAAPPRFTLLAAFHGALHGVHFAADHPDRVARLILVSPIVDGKAYRAKVRRWDSIRDMATSEWEDYTLTMAAANVGYDDPALLQSLAHRMREAMSPSAVQAMHEVVADIDARDALPRLTMPVLLLFNAGISRIHSADDMRSIAADIPDCELALFDRPGAELWRQDMTDTVERFLGVAPVEPVPDATPSRTANRPATGLKTILFTDIEANTALLQRVGDAAWRAILRDCERTTRDLLAAHEGTEIKVMGDAFMASFSSASAAIDCAVALQRMFLERAESSSDGLRIRIGINAGEPIAEDDDLFGTAVTMASRIQSLAKGGEILVSDVVRQLVAGKGFLFHDRGETALRGFEDPVRLYEVRWQE